MGASCTHSSRKASRPDQPITALLRYCSEPVGLAELHGNSKPAAVSRRKPAIQPAANVPTCDSVPRLGVATRQDRVAGRSAPRTSAWARRRPRRSPAPRPGGLAAGTSSTSFGGGLERIHLAAAGGSAPSTGEIAHPPRCRRAVWFNMSSPGSQRFTSRVVEPPGAAGLVEPASWS